MEDHLTQIPSLTTLRSALDKAIGVRESLEKRKAELDKEVKALENEDEILNLVVELFRRMADAEISEAVQAVESLQTDGVQTVFYDQNLSVKAKVHQKRGKVCVDLLTVREYADGKIIEGKSIDGFGGSLTTVQSVLMRIIVMVKHGLRPFLVLDESLMAIEDRYVPQLGQLLRSLCERLDIDMLLITHNPALAETAHGHWKLRNPKGPVRFEKVR